MKREIITISFYSLIVFVVFLCFLLAKTVKDKDEKIMDLEETISLQDSLIGIKTEALTEIYDSPYWVGEQKTIN
jgi:uncharacterized membrane protein YvbJ